MDKNKIFDRIKEIRTQHKGGECLKMLQELALEVGACTWGPEQSGTVAQGEKHLLEQINQAVQTQCVVDMCESATKGYETAKKSGKTMAIIATISAISAFISALVALVAVIVGITTN